MKNKRVEQTIGGGHTKNHKRQNGKRSDGRKNGKEQIWLSSANSIKENQDVNAAINFQLFTLPCGLFYLKKNCQPNPESSTLKLPFFFHQFQYDI